MNRAPHRYLVVTVLAAAAAYLALAPAARADVLFSYGYNARGIAMGGAAAAQSKDFGVAYYNPAGGVLLRHPALGVGFLKTGNWLETMYADDAPLLSTEGIIAGVVLPFPFGGVLEDRIAFGFAGLLPRGTFLDLDVPSADEAQYVLLRNSGKQATLSPSLSVRLHDSIAIGGGAQLFSNTLGSTTAVVDANGNTEAYTGQEVSTSFAPSYGVMLRPGELAPALRPVSLGFVYREAFFTKYRIPVSSFIGTTPIRLVFNATSLYTPRQWTGGIAFNSDAYGVVWEFDVSYNEWRKFPDPSLFVDAQFVVPLINVEFLDGKEIDPNFHDTITLRTGGELNIFTHKYVGMLMQTGYFYDPSPVPAQTGVTNFLDSDRHVVSLGAGWEWYRLPDYDFGGPFTLQLTGQLHYLRPRVFHKNTNVDAENPGYPKIGLSGTIWAVAVDLSFEFDFELDENGEGGS
ncbi:outer membrane protein transport protein [bacterium]|nr:outer membrane protein transport protein [bacterium]